MKSRLTTYLLIVAVAVLWGIIIKKVFFSPPSPGPAVHSETKAAAKAEDYEPLVLDYRDPFRPAPKPKAAAPSAGKKSVPAPQPPARGREKVTIKFIGRLQCGGSTNYIVELNGRQHTLSVGEDADGFRLVREFPDSLHLVMNGNTYTVLVTE